MFRKSVNKLFFIVAIILISLCCCVLMFFPKAVCAKETSLPTQYKNNITGLTIGNQTTSGLSNLCWDFSASKVVESFLLNKTEETMNISESWVSLAYMYYVNSENTLINATNRPNGSFESYDNENYVYNSFGDVFYYQRALNAYGVVFEEDCPLDISVNVSNEESEIYYKTVFNSYYCLSDNLIVSNLEFKSIVCYGSDYSNTDSDKELLAVVNNMKHYLFNSGALSTYIVAGNVYTFENENKYVYYNNSSLKPTHALTIIGYDDTKIFSNTLTGGFLAINSYGEETFELWIPYEMYRPNIVGTTETNKILSSTFYISNIASYNTNWAVSYNKTEVSTINNYLTGGNPMLSQHKNTSDSQNLTTILMTYFGKDYVITLVAIIAGIVFVVTSVVILVLSSYRKKKTEMINKEVLEKSLAKFRKQEQNFEKEKAELEQDLQDMRYQAYRKKQRRLKRLFHQRLENKDTNNTTENDETNKS